jgi:putative transposase
VKYAYIDLYRSQYPVKTLCRILEVSRSSYYSAKSGQPSLHTREDLVLRREIIRVHAEHRWTPGAVKMWRLLNAKGVRCGKHRVARLRQVEGIKTNRTRRFQRKKAMDRSEPPAPDLVKRAFGVPMPNLVWVGDMTLIRTKEGWLHLAIVLDLFSRRIVGWATDENPIVALPSKALAMAIDARKPDHGLIFHSDQGSAYSSCSYRQLLA